MTLRLLLIEDNQADADLAMEMLTLAPGYVFDIKHVTGLQAALEVLEESDADIDAVLLDLNLPDSQGLDTLRQIRALAPEMPLIVLSGLVNDRLRGQALREGAQDFIGKNEPTTKLLARSILYSLERHRAEVQHQQVEKLVASNPDAVIVTDKDNAVRFVNRAAEKLFGVKRAELLGEQLVFASENGSPAEIELLRGDGTRTAEVRVVDFVWDGEPASLAAIRDNTDLKRIQTQLMLSDRMASVGILAAGVAHEINNPLAAVIANLSLVTHSLEQIESLDPAFLLDDFKIGLQDAQEAAERVRLIVRDLRIFSRAEEDKRGSVDLREVLESTLRMAWNEVRHRACLVKEYGKVAAVDCNESRLCQVFLNLVINAAQAIPEGRAQANEIRVKTYMDGGHRVVTEIRDTGPGIPPATLKKLFTPFFTTKPVGQGTGLGLAICQRIVSEIGGEITVESEVGVGTTFRVILPATSQPPVEEISEELAITRSARRGRVLLVDDDPMIGRVVERTLSQDHDVTVFTSAAKALEHLNGGAHFDVILCDLMMPVMTGMDFYIQLQTDRHELVPTVIFLTGGAFTPKTREFLDTVSNPRVDKPFETRELQNMINERIA